MPIAFFIKNEPLSLTNGLPPDYKGHILHGSQNSHYINNELSIIIQEAESALSCFRKIHIIFKKPVSLKCIYTHENRVLFARSVIDHPATEYIKAGGIQQYNSKQFACLFGLNWQSLLSPEHSCEYIFYDTIWNEALLEYKRKRIFIQEMNHAGDYVPHRLHAGRLCLSMNMDKMLHILRHFHYESDYLDFLDINMDRFLTLTINAISNPNYDSFNIKEEHFKAVERAIAYIRENLYNDFTIPHLSKIAITNPTNLKRYFSTLTGFTIDDFKTHMRMMPALMELIHTNKAVKEMYIKAGYTSASAFCAGFRKVFLCTPTEVRTQEWDTSFL
jgi:AraC-like DNA-binding protein